MPRMQQQRLSTTSLVLAMITLLAAITFVAAAPTSSLGLSPREQEDAGGVTVTNTVVTTVTVTPPPTATATSTAAPTTTTTTSTTSTTAEGGDGTGRDGLDEMEVIGTAWYPGWMAQEFPPSSIHWDRYNLMTFAFALTTEDGSLDLGDEAHQETLRTFVTEAHKNGVKALLSIGGWTGSRFFSTNVATPESRTAFVQAITDAATEYQLDGIDFDWEYPNLDGIGCNAKNPEDADNFLAFLKELKGTEVGSRLMFTAAASIKPFAGPSGEPASDVSGFAEVFDFLAIMNYDIYGPWAATTGPNAPLKDSCASAETQLGSAEGAVAAWTGAGFPPEKLLLGVAAYGRSFHVPLNSAKTEAGALNAFTSFDKTAKPLGEGETADTTHQDVCGNSEGPSGVWTFNGLIEGGLLGADGNPAEGIDYMFDECSQTPFVYNQATQTLVSYDDARSFEAKGQFIAAQKMRGFAVWHVLGDSSDDILLNSMHEGMGIVSEPNPTDCPKEEEEEKSAPEEGTSTEAPPEEGDDPEDGSEEGDDDYYS